MIVGKSIRTKRVEAINQALAIMGLWNLPFGKKGWKQIYDKCVAEMAKAERAADTERFKQLSQAKQVFRRRMGRNWCCDCGVTINGKAERCATCQREPKVRALLLDNSSSPASKRNGERASKRRTFPASELAMAGYWSSQVQDVVAKWKETIGEDWCQHYAWAAFNSVFYGDSISVPVAGRGHKAPAIDFLAALNNLATSKKRADVLTRSLLEMAAGGSADYQKQGVEPYPDGTDELQRRIKQCTGLSFSGDAIKKRIERLRVNDRTVPRFPPAECSEIIARMLVTK